MFVIIISTSLRTHDPYISSNIKYLPWLHLIASAIEAIQRVAGLKVLPLGWRKWSGGFVVIFSTAKNFSLTFYQLASLFLATKRRPWNFKTRPFKIYKFRDIHIHHTYIYIIYDPSSLFATKPLRLHSCVLKPSNFVSRFFVGARFLRNARLGPWIPSASKKAPRHSLGVGDLPMGS